MTELYEKLDWIKNLINNTYENRSGIEPSHKARKIVQPLQIYKLRPKKNCKQCGVQSCMAFAAKLNKFDAEVDDCPLFQQDEFAELRDKLLKEME
jgi:ArsR family metal-binding transcriptional regulator